MSAAWASPVIAKLDLEHVVPEPTERSLR